MVPWLYAVSEPTLTEDSPWVIDVVPGRTDWVSHRYAVFLWSGVLLVAVWLSFQFFGFSAMIAAALSVVACACLERLFFQFHHCTFPIRMTPYAVCRRDHGQMALKLVKVVFHPMCIMLTVRAQDSEQSRSEKRVLLWRHHYPVEKYRRLTLILKWLGSEGRHE